MKCGENNDAGQDRHQNRLKIDHRQRHEINGDEDDIDEGFGASARQVAYAIAIVDQKRNPVVLVVKRRDRDRLP